MNVYLKTKRQLSSSTSDDNIFMEHKKQVRSNK